MSSATFDHDVVVVGTGFGASMTALTLARALKARGQGESILMLERGTWWTTPVGTVQDKEVKTYGFLKDTHGQPVQYWSSAENFRGFIDLFTRCVRRKGNEDGLYDLTTFGRKGLLGLGLSDNDGVTIVRASGVGGGSLVYANVTIRPPDEVLDDARWPLTWSHEERDAYFDLARDAIGLGVGYALYQRDITRDPSKISPQPPKPINTGLSNIATRSARLNPNFVVKPDPLNAKRGVKRLDPARSTAINDDNALWIDRARVFQSAAADAGLTADYGTVDSSINDITPEPSPFDPKGQPKNYCERQGRCIIGCLPGARHTLNKQLMTAALGKPDGTAAVFSDLHVNALCEVDSVQALPDGGYRVHYLQRDPDDPSKTTNRSVTAARVVMGAGCVGTNEIMLRSKQQGGLPHLSDQVGNGFSTNGDYLAFLDNTKQRISLTRGPVTTSFAHFNSPTAGPNADLSAFHTIEDNGIPRAFSSLTGHGLPLLRSLSKGRHHRLFILATVLRYALGRIPAFVKALLRNQRTRQEQFASEDEWTTNMMCIAAMGREQSVGQFRLGSARRDTTLRLARTDGKAFHEDPIYKQIKDSLDKLAGALTDDPDSHFINPFLTDAADALGTRSTSLSHPLGGCRTATSSDDGVVDEYGRVFDTSRHGQLRPYYEGLYITDAARIPTALGVNPSLTISALALRSADKIIDELPAITAAHPAPIAVP
jgi:choline dehydrogenase-like flavoprotein